jgi:hypothetical protein
VRQLNMKKLLLIAIVAASVTGCKKTYVCESLLEDGTHTGYKQSGLSKDEKNKKESEYWEDISGNQTTPQWYCQPE